MYIFGGGGRLAAKQDDDDDDEGSNTFPDETTGTNRQASAHDVSAERLSSEVSDVISSSSTMPNEGAGNATAISRGLGRLLGHFSSSR